ncbi:MAG TPA: TolC family protein [Gemmatimonadaceae bacterium]
MIQSIRKRPWSTPVVALVTIGALLPAQTVTARPTMAEAVAFALRFSPELTIARLQVDSAQGERAIARALPNPTFSVTPGNPFQYSVTQPADIGPGRVYRGRAAARGITAARLDEQNVERQLVFAVRQSFLDLQLAEATRDIAFQQDTIMRRLLQSDSLRFLEGDLAQRDLYTTELQSAHAEANLARAEAVARGARINLQVLIGVQHPDTAFRVTGALEYRALDLPLDSAMGVALANRPDVAAAGERVEQSRAMRSLASSLILPVPGVTAVRQSAPFSTGSNYALGVSLSLPIVYWFSGERARATAGVQSAEVSKQRAIAATEGDIAVAANNFAAARALSARYASGLLAKARAALEMQRFAYEHGSASLLDLLTAINAFGDTQTDYYTALRDYWVAAYAMVRAVGRDLTP